MARRKQSLDAGRLPPLTGERGSGRLCGLRNRGQHVDKLAQRTAGRAPFEKRGLGAWASCAEDGASGGCWGGPTGLGQDCFGSSNSNKSAREARGHHTQAPVAEGLGAARAGMILRNQRDSATSPDASASPTRKRHRTFRGPLVESLILAQDQRWRRA